MSIEVEGRRPLDGRSLVRIPLAIAIVVGACVVGLTVSMWTRDVLPISLVMSPAFFGGIALAFRVTRRIRPSTSLGKVRFEGDMVSFDDASFDNAGIQVESADRQTVRVRDASGRSHALPRLVVPLSGAELLPLSSWEIDVVEGRVVLVNIVPRGRHEAPARVIVAPK